MSDEPNPLSGETKPSRLPSILTALRGLLVLLGGLFALFFPGTALSILIVGAGILFLIDGVLGLWSITFGGAKTGNFWFDVVRNVLSVLTGAVILVSPWIATLLTIFVVVYFVAIQAIIVGVMEIWTVIRERAQYAKIWPVLLSGVVYVLIGLLLFFVPVTSALVMIMLGGVLMVVLALGLLGWAFRLYKEGH